MQRDKGDKRFEMKSSGPHRLSGVNHKKLPISIDLAVTTCKVRDEPDQIKTPDAAKLRKLDAVLEIFDIGITTIEVLQPLGQRFGIVHAVEVPAFDGSEVFVMGWNRIEAPVTAVRKNVLMRVDA